MLDPRSRDNESTAEEFEAVKKRAEVMVDRTAERIGFYASKAWCEARRLVSRAREEAEDIWVEAQLLSRGETTDGDD